MADTWAAPPEGPFTNLDGSTPQPFSQVFRWAVIDRVTGRRRKAPPRADVPTVAVSPDQVANPPPGGLRLTWLGHASWLVQLGGTSLLIDPVLGPSIGGVIKRNVPVALTPELLPRIDAQLVTHNHRDHMDLPSLAAVRAPVVAGLHSADLLGRRVPDVAELGWWQSTRIGGVTVTFVPSQHWSRRGLFDANRSLWGGFVLQGGGVSVYHAGDTAYFDGFAEIGRRFPGLDAALLPIGAYDPAWFMSKQHMNPEEAAQAFVDLGAQRFVAMHWGTFKLTDEPLDEPPRRLFDDWRRRRLSEERLQVLPIGGQLQLRSP